MLPVINQSGLSYGLMVLLTHCRTLMRFSSAPAWSGRMMSHSCFGLGGAVVVVVRGILRMRGFIVWDTLLVVGSGKEGGWRRGDGGGGRRGGGGRGALG